MDSAIRQIMELDASVENRLKAASRIAQTTMQDARSRAAAIEQASGRKIQDAITDMDVSMRAECEQRSAEVRKDADARAVALQQDFSGRRDELLETLFQAVLNSAGS